MPVVKPPDARRSILTIRLLAGQRVEWVAQI